MEDNTITIEQAVELFEQQRYREAVAAFAEIYNSSKNKDERAAVFETLADSFYAPNEEALRENYEKNLQALKQYPYFWQKVFRKFEELTFQLFPISDEYFYCYSKERDCFFGEYDAATRHQMRYFFENLDEPLKVENEDNFYNLNFLNDNVRDSEDYAGDNHIYLFYDTLDPLERLMLTCDLEPVLQQKKFVFLVGEENRDRYPINFKKKFGIDYSQMKPRPLRIEEINRIYFNQWYSRSGTDFFEGVLNGSDHILVINAWFFYELSAKDVIETYVDYIQDPERIINVSQFLDVVQKRINDVKLNVWQYIAAALPDVLSGRTAVTVHEMWKAIMIATMQVSFQMEKKQYLSRIAPIIFYDPHYPTYPHYFELLKYFKYPAVEATFREPIMRLIRYMGRFGLGRNEETLRLVLRSAYEQSKILPRWLTDAGYYVAKFEDLKLNSEKTLRTICRFFNIPYTEKLLDGSIGLWGALGANEMGERLIGYDTRAVNRDISDMVPPEDRKRLELYYWNIHHHFRYPCTDVRLELSRDDAEEIFSVPFRFEQVYASQRASYYKQLETAAPAKKQQILDYIDQRYALEPDDFNAIVKRTMIEDCLNGFDPEVALPTVMFPEDEMDWPSDQAQRLQMELDKRGGQVKTQSE